MKKLFVLEISLLALRERKARRIVFDRNRTLIFGRNGVGKSSLIKSIYRTFGAEPVMPTAFTALKAVSVVKFEIDEVVYSILREGDRFGIFDSENNLLHQFDSVTNELGPYLANLFKFLPQFQTVQGKFIIPPPAYLFLPYYLDQDESWVKSWASFTRLQQIKNYRRECIAYHSGLRPNDYFITRIEIQKYDEVIATATKERDVVQKLLHDLRQQFNQTDFNIDVDQFKAEVTELLVELDKLKVLQQEYKHKLSDLYSISAVLDAQMIIVEGARKETNTDIRFAVQELPSIVSCPTCGATYENSFVERFELAKDAETSKELFIELRRDQEDIQKQVAEVNKSLTKTNEQVVRVENILDQRRGDLVLKDVIDNAGKNQLKEIFQEKIKQWNGVINENTYKRQIEDAKLKRLENQDRKNSINTLFFNSLRNNLIELAVDKVDADSYRRVSDTKIEAITTGSARPRALLAYYFAFFTLMSKECTSTFCPIIIDSPNQQDQDMENVDKLLGFINTHQPDGTQLILGMSETFGIDFDCSVIELSEKGSLLQESEFDEVQGRIQLLLDRFWLRPGQLF